MMIRGNMFPVPRAGGVLCFLTADGFITDVPFFLRRTKKAIYPFVLNQKTKKIYSLVSKIWNECSVYLLFLVLLSFVSAALSFFKRPRSLFFFFGGGATMEPRTLFTLVM